MKAMNRNDASHRQSRHRKGGAFAYVMAYMTLSAMLLALSGSTLHSILQTADADQKTFREIHVTEAAAVELRDDGRRCAVAELNDDDLTLEFPDSISVVWTVDDHQLRREETQAGQLRSQDLFRFQPGTEMTFRRESNGLFVFRVTFPPLAHLQTASAKSEGARRSVDIVFSISGLKRIP